MKINEDETRFAVAGDWHGSTRWAQNVVKEVSELGIRTIFQVGDFGVWAGEAGGRFVKGVNNACEEYDVTIYVTLGNHEDYDYLETKTADEDGIIWLKDHIAVLPRPFRFNIGEYSVLSLGGAPSIDFPYRTEHVDWWPQEMITDEQLYAAVDGGHADIMLTHDAPDVGAHSVMQIINGNPMGWPPESIAYADQGRAKMTHAVSEIQPDLMFHGHYHAPGVGNMAHGGTIYSMGMNGQRHNVAIFNIVDDLSVEWSDIS